MIQMKATGIIILIALAALAQTSAIQCEANAPPRPDKKFSLSDR